MFRLDSAFFFSLPPLVWVETLNQIKDEQRASPLLSFTFNHPPLFFFLPEIPLHCSHGNGTLGMKGNHNFVAGLIWRHERCQMKSLSKPLLILFIARRSLRNLFPPLRLWFDSPVVLDLVPPWYLWHVDIKWLQRQAAPIFQSPLSRGYLSVNLDGKNRPDDKQTFTDTNNCNYIRGWAAGHFLWARKVNIVYTWPLDLSKKQKNTVTDCLPVSLLNVLFSHQPCQLEERYTSSTLFSLKKIHDPTRRSRRNIVT